ncbi:MAG: hypothetical protein WCC60_22800 [Ilumatobacteraceae bacterium]
MHDRDHELVDLAPEVARHGLTTRNALVLGERLGDRGVELLRLRPVCELAGQKSSIARVAKDSASRSRVCSAG